MNQNTGTARLRAASATDALTLKRKEYARLRAAGTRAIDALVSARAHASFWRRTGLSVRLTAVMDADPDLSYLEQEEFADVRKREYERANRDGVWVLKAEYLNPQTNEWEETDSVGGFIGRDYEDSGYDTDLMRSALAGRLKSLRLWRNMCAAAP
jgi:hypothetical protein